MIVLRQKEFIMSPEQVKMAAEKHPKLMKNILERMEIGNINPERVTKEITETLLKNPDAAILISPATSFIPGTTPAGVAMIKRRAEGKPIPYWDAIWNKTGISKVGGKVAEKIGSGVGKLRRFLGKFYPGGEHPSDIEHIISKAYYKPKKLLKNMAKNEKI